MKKQDIPSGRAELRKLARHNRRDAGRKKIAQNAAEGQKHKLGVILKKRKAKRKQARAQRKENRK
jgi:hypothetical protein